MPVYEEPPATPAGIFLRYRENENLKLVLFNLGVELVLFVVVAEHFACAGEGACANGVADFRIVAGHFDNLCIDVLEQQLD